MSVALWIKLAKIFTLVSGISLWIADKFIICSAYSNRQANACIDRGYETLKGH